jgi:hypothetical protein
MAPAAYVCDVEVHGTIVPEAVEGRFDEIVPSKPSGTGLSAEAVGNCGEGTSYVPGVGNNVGFCTVVDIGA